MSDPSPVEQTSLPQLLARCGRKVPERGGQQPSLLQADHRPSSPIWYRGNPDVLQGPAVSVVGTRKVSKNGVARARRLVRELVGSGVAIVSGLAMGVDTAAHTAALEFGGRTAAILGTPLDRCSPKSNAELQELLAREHLVVSQFAIGTQVYPSNFPQRNRTMAALTDATVIVEASDSSGTLHQAAECIRLGRWLFLLRSLVENPDVTWAANFLQHPRCEVLDGTQAIVARIAR